jgi:hypothetical protein
LYRIPDDVIRLKHRIFIEIKTALDRAGKTIDSLFNKVDVDQSHDLELNEFRALF